MKESVLVWNSGNNASYREARRQITARNRFAPKTIKDIDFASFFIENKDALVYFPVFSTSMGWWGAMLGSGAKIQAKIIVSPECQLYEIGTSEQVQKHQLFAAEILPKSDFLKEIKKTIVIKDAIATDYGTILALLTGGNESKVRSLVGAFRGEYLGSLGGY